MPRTGRVDTGGLYCHVLNRGNGRAAVFHDARHYDGFVDLLGKACRRDPMRIAAACLMPNHFHLVVRPRADGDLGRWMHWLMTSHVRRYPRRYGTSGHVWQGRFKSFVIESRRPSAAERAAGVVQTGDPVLEAARYVERDPPRAGLVDRAEDRPWSSLHWWAKQAKTGTGSPVLRNPEGEAGSAGQTPSTCPERDTPLGCVSPFSRRSQTR